MAETAIFMGKKLPPNIRPWNGGGWVGWQASARPTKVGRPGEHVANHGGQQHADHNQTGNSSGVVGCHGISRGRFGRGWSDR